MTRKESLQYVKNTNGGATVLNFIEDWAPVGAYEWHLLMSDGLVQADRDGKIWLTSVGEAKLNELNGAKA